MSLQLKGLGPLLKALDPQTYAPLYRRFWARVAIRVQSKMRERAPVDTGRLRASIAYEIDPRNPPLWAKVGTNVKYGLPLDQPETRFPHYRAGPFAGQPTSGWLSGAPALIADDIARDVETLGQEIADAFNEAK